MISSALGENLHGRIINFRSVYRYPCPGCRSDRVLHARDCRFEDRSRQEIERAHIEIISILSQEPVRKEELRAALGGSWTDLHESVLRMLSRDSRVDFEDNSDRLFLVPPAEIADRIEPTSDPLRTIYKYGSVPGAHDNSVFAIIAYYASKGLTWEETRQQVLNWLRESGTWERGGFEESSPEALVDAKRHVYESGYGYLEKATAAKRVIDNSAVVETGNQ